MEEQKSRELKPEEAEMLARFEEELRRMKVDEHIVTMMQSLATLAVRKLGMSPEMSTERDLEQAKLAIEGFKVLIPVVEGMRPMEEIQAHKRMLADLQMAYVNALKEE